MNAERPIGQRYSHVYLNPGEPVYESRRLQLRAGAYITSNASSDAKKITSTLEMEVGASIQKDYPAHRVAEYLKQCQTAEFLECITVITRALRQADFESKSYDRSRKSNWVQFISRAMAEENSKFEIDLEGGVHPRIDPEFTAARVASVQALGGNRYATAREHFEAGHAALDERPMATNRAVREVFMANEEVFKLVCPSAKRLEGSEVSSKLNAAINGLFTGTERDAAMAMSRAVVDYIAASHLYRHAQGEPEQPPLSLETATFMIGTGTALLRWLLWLDVRFQTSPQAVS